MQRSTAGQGGENRQQPSGAARPPGARGDRDQQPSIDVSKIRFSDPVEQKLYSDIAEEAAKTVSPGQRAQKNKPTQLRRFYDELVLLQERVASDDEKFEQQAPFIQMLKAKVAYARGRDKVDANFEKLLRHVIDEVKNPQTLKRAKLFMEAFMAFYKVHGPTD